MLWFVTSFLQLIVIIKASILCCVTTSILWRLICSRFGVKLPFQSDCCRHRVYVSSGSTSKYHPSSPDKSLLFWSIWSILCDVFNITIFCTCCDPIIWHKQGLTWYAVVNVVAGFSQYVCLQLLWHYHAGYSRFHSFVRPYCENRNISVPSVWID